MSLDNKIIGFIDESSPQTTSNTMGLWSFDRPEITKNTSKFRANTFGFYSPNGISIADFHDNSRKEDIISFMKKIRRMNPYKRIIAIIDNFKPHHSNETVQRPNELKIGLLYLPPYSPDLNPIEYSWKNIKREISRVFIGSEQHLKYIISSQFHRFSSRL